MKIFILRHAKTQEESLSGEDFDRDLKPKGFRQLKFMRSFFESNFEDLTFRIYCSDAVRTRSTFKELESSLIIKEVSFHNELYLQSLKGLLQFLWSKSDENQSVLLIGHNNGLSELCSYLSGKEVWLPTCGLVVYDFPDFSNINEVSRETGIETYRYFPKP
jgi:phosphohistidine phosphatase